MDISTLPGWVGEVGGWFVGAIAVGFAVIQAYSSKFSATEKIKDQASKDLVKILQATVDTLRTEMKELQLHHLQNVEAIANLKGENSTLAKILQGRDETYLKFQQDGFMAFRKIEESNNGIKELVQLLDKHLTKRN